jgi:hypothetical protein
MKLIIMRPPKDPKIINLPDHSIKLAFLIRDTMSFDTYQNLIDRYGIPDALVSEAHPEYPEIDLLGHATKYYYSPWFLKNETNYLTSNTIIFDNCDSEYCFNFMINKKQINRHLLLKLVEWGNLSSYQYTWSGIGSNFNMSGVLDHFDLLEKHVDVNKFRSHMLLPVSKILPCFVHKDSSVNDSIHNNLSSFVDVGNTGWVWDNVVGNIFSKSAVSLISESVAYEKIINFTEKTLYSILGLTFPIWIGGYRQAELWKQHGFDTFDDVINHDYQYYDTLLERCFYAIHDNLQILTDLKYARYTKQQHILRLKQNRDNLRSNIENVYNNSLVSLPIPNLWSMFSFKTAK